MEFLRLHHAPHQKKIIAFVIATIISGLLIILLCDFYARQKAGPYIYRSVDAIPYNEVGMVLGVSRTVGKISNEYFFNRIDVAVKLYKAGKIKYIMVSGAKCPGRNYDEMEDMKNALLDHGIPPDVIIQDGAGFRTLDSIIRAKNLLNMKKFTIISQHFHNTRAVYIARFYKLDVVAIDAPDCGLFYWELQTFIREHLAKVKMMLDLHILKTKPAINSAIYMVVPDSVRFSEITSN